MSQIIKKDLSIFRGTYRECKAFEDNHAVEDMKFYLAWDTQEIFVGNARGQLVLYGVSKSLFKYIDENFEEVKIQIQKRLDELTTEFEDYVHNYIGNNVEDITLKALNNTLTNLLDKIEKNTAEKVDEMLETIQGTVNSNFENIENTQKILNKHLTDSDKRLDLLEEKSEEYSENILDIDNRLKNIEGSGLENRVENIISKHIEDSEKRYALKKDLEEYNTSINVRIDNIESEIEELNFVKSSDFESYKTETNVRLDNLETFKSDVENNYLKKTDLSTEFSNINARIDNVDTEISTLKNSVNNNTYANDISDIKERLDKIDDGTNTRIKSIEEDISEINSKIDNFDFDIEIPSVTGSQILYRTGDQMRETLLDNDGKELTKDTMIVCIARTTNTTGTIYNPGMYYYSLSEDKIIAIPAGKIEIGYTYIKTTLETPLKNWFTNTTQNESYPIANKEYTFNIFDRNSTEEDLKDTTSIYTKVDKLDALKDTDGWNMYYSNNIDNSNTKIGSGPFFSKKIIANDDAAVSFNSKNPGTHTITINLYKKTTEGNTQYQVSHASYSENVTFYKPWCIKVLDSEFNEVGTVVDFDDSRVTSSIIPAGTYTFKFNDEKFNNVYIAEENDLGSVTFRFNNPYYIRFYKANNTKIDIDSDIPESITANASQEVITVEHADSNTNVEGVSYYAFDDKISSLTKKDGENYPVYSIKIK